MHSDDVHMLANCLARLPQFPPDEAKIRNLKAPIPGDADLWNHCTCHGIGPLVYHNLKALSLDSLLGSEIRENFKKGYYRTLSRNLIYADALHEIAGALKGCPVIVLKGLALISLIYTNPALRPMTDIDLLVRPADLQTCKNILRRLGYVPAPRYPDIFIRGPIALDLHTDPLNTERIASRGKAVVIAPDAMWAHARPIPDYAPLHMLGLNDQIITLATHALKHGFSRKIWLLDILGCLYQVENDGAREAAIDACLQARALNMLQLSLQAITAHLSHPMPFWATTLQKSFPIGRIRLKILKVVTSDQPFQILEPLYLMESQKSLRAKLHCLWEMAFPSKAAMIQISGLSGRWTFWLAYPYRAVQLAGRGGLQIAQMLYRIAFSKTQNPQQTTDRT